jgi:hypothetical protein
MTYPRSIDQEPGFRDLGITARTQLGDVAGPSPVREIIDLAMVGLMGGGPRLAIRAARVLLEDSYTARVSERGHRLGRRTGELRR